MADTVTTKILRNSGNYVTIHLTCQSDGTGETLVKKLDLKDLKMSTGISPRSLTLVEAKTSVNTFSYVTIYWDRPPSPAAAIVLRGVDSVSFKSVGGIPDPARDQGGTGNILLSSTGASNGCQYDIILEFRLKALKPARVNP